MKHYLYQWPLPLRSIKRRAHHLMKAMIIGVAMYVATPRVMVARYEVIINLLRCIKGSAGSP